MDSQEQYEALLKQWGYSDTSVENRARQQLRARRVKAVVAFLKENVFKRTIKTIKKIGVRPQPLGQISN